MAEGKRDKELATELTLELIKQKRAEVNSPDMIAQTWLRIYKRIYFGINKEE